MSEQSQGRQLTGLIRRAHQFRQWCRTGCRLRNEQTRRSVQAQRPFQQVQAIRDHAKPGRLLIGLHLTVIPLLRMG